MGAIPRQHFVLLLALVGIYTGLVTYFCQLRFENFYSQTFDLGVNQQLLWTASHGYLLYETPDLVTTGIHSFLEIHSTYVAFLVAPLYSALPYPATLFALESAAVASTIFPLYLVARGRGVPPAVIFAALLLFLANFGLLSSLFYDFHWEAFLPVELLWFYFLVRRRSYRLAVVPLVLGFVTLEIFPVLVVGVALLLLYERARALGLRPAAWLRDHDVRVAVAFTLASVAAYGTFLVLAHHVIPALVGTSGGTGVYTGVNPSYTVLATWSSLSPSAVYWALLIASLGFFPVFSPRSLLPTLPWLVESVLLQPFYSSAFGDQYALIAMATLAIAYVEGVAVAQQLASRPGRAAALAGAAALGGAAANLLAFGNSATLLSGAALGPRGSLLAGRSTWPLVLGLVATIAAVATVVAVSRAVLPRRLRSAFRARPWLPGAAAVLGTGGLGALALFDVLCVAVPPDSSGPVGASVWWVLLVPPLCATAFVLARLAPTPPQTPKRRPLLTLASSSGVTATRSMWVVAVALIVGVNFAMSPLNPVNFEASREPGYEFSYSPNPVYPEMGWLVSQIPANAVVLATNDLFPYAANDPNVWPSQPACGFSTCSPAHLPFSATSLPDFVLMDMYEWGQLPTYVRAAVLNESEYGLVAQILSTGALPGSVYLFEHGFRGPMLSREVSPATRPYVGSAWDLNVGPSGWIAPDSQSKYGNVIESRNATEPTALPSDVWAANTTAVFPPDGIYEVTCNLSGDSPFAASAPSTPVLEVNTSPRLAVVLPAYFSVNLTAGELDASGWAELRFLVAFVPSDDRLEFQGFLYYTGGSPNGNVTLNYIEATPY